MATTPDGYGRFIGRVGGLAVALGIGVAIANGAAIASADDGQSDSSKSSSAESKSTDSNPSSTSTASKDEANAGTTTHNTASTEPSAASSTDDEAKATDAKTSGSKEDADESPTPGRKSRKLADTSTTSTTQTLAAKTTVAEPSPAATTTDTTTTAVAAQALAVSPLGTPEQLAAEQRAAETANTLPVQLMKLVLQFGWMSTARQEFSLVGGPDQENTDALKQAVDEYAMAAAFQQQILNPMTPTAVMQVAPPHTWYGQDVDGSRILYDNPDTIYRFMGVNKTSTYVITGRFTGEDPAETTFSVLTGLSGTTAPEFSTATSSCATRTARSPSPSAVDPPGRARITSSSPTTPP